MTTPQVPAQFFRLPDGSMSSVQVKVVTDAAGGITLVPAAVTTPEQMAQWQQIQAAMPPSPSQYDAKMAVAMARPVASADAEADASAPGWLDSQRFAAEAQAGVVAVTEASAPRTQAEHDQRTHAAARLAAALGLALVAVPYDEVMKVPAHLELRQSGNPYMAGNLVTIETALRGMARERAKRDAQIAQWEAHRAQVAAERAEAIAALPENRIKRLEAALAEAGITV